MAVPGRLGESATEVDISCCLEGTLRKQGTLRKRKNDAARRVA